MFILGGGGGQWTLWNSIEVSVGVNNTYEMFIFQTLSQLSSEGAINKTNNQYSSTQQSSSHAKSNKTAQQYIKASVTVGSQYNPTRVTPV